MINLAICASGADEISLVSQISEHLSQQVKIQKRCVDLAELLAVTATGLTDVAVVDIDTAGLSREVVQELYLRKVAVLALENPDSFNSHTAVGISQVLEIPLDTDALYESLLTAAFEAQESNASAWVQNESKNNPESLGPRVAIWGPSGSTGKSFLAMNLANETALSGVRTLLIDADTYGPCQSQLFGVIDDGPGIIAACRAAAKGTFDENKLLEYAPQISTDLHLLSGVGVPARFGEVEKFALQEVVKLASSAFDISILDMAANLELSEAYAEFGLERNAATLTALSASTDIYAVVNADPVSVTRFIRDYSRLKEISGAPLTLVLNRVDGVVKSKEITKSICARVELEQYFEIPNQPQIASRALWDGALLSESAPKSELRKAIQLIAKDLLAKIV